MERPTCEQHPNGRVQRWGRYGKRRQYIRWQCLPGNGDAAHMLRPELSCKQHGGPQGECLECERVWGELDGMPTGTGDRFTLREKAAALIALAEGKSYRRAAERARLSGGYGRRVWGILTASHDGRLTADWVSQYAPILAAEYLPRAWPRVVLLDALPVHIRDRSGPTPRPSGRVSFVILAASSYVGGRAVPWRLIVRRRQGKREWEALLRGLPGRPQYVVCDRNQTQMSAVESVWPGVRVYACTAHLTNNVLELLRKGALYDRRRRLVRVLNEHTFTQPGAYVAFRQVLARYLASDLSRLTPRQTKGVLALARWMRENEDHIAQSLVENHWPVSVGSLERFLREVKVSIYDRRFALKNLPRLEHLLMLMQLRQMGRADEREWARLLREHHRRTSGAPPPRRRVDDPRLAPR